MHRINIRRGFIEHWQETLPAQETKLQYNELTLKSWIAKGRGLYFLVEPKTLLEYGRGKTKELAIQNAIENIEFYTQGKQEIWDKFIQSGINSKN